MSSTKQLMLGWSNTGWSIRDSSCRNCHHYDRVGTYLCPHHRIGHNLECGSCNIRLGTQHLPAIHVRVLRDKWPYRAAKARRIPAAGDQSMTTTASDQQIVPHHLPSTLVLRAADRGVASAPGVRHLRKHQARLRRPVAVVQRLVWRRRPPIPAGGTVDARGRPNCRLSPPPPLPRSTSGRLTNLLTGTGACARL